MVGVSSRVSKNDTGGRVLAGRDWPQNTIQTKDQDSFGLNIGLSVIAITARPLEADQQMPGCILLLLSPSVECIQDGPLQVCLVEIDVPKDGLG